MLKFLFININTYDPQRWNKSTKSTEGSVGKGDRQADKEDCVKWTVILYKEQRKLV